MEVATSVVHETMISLLILFCVIFDAQANPVETKTQCIAGTTECEETVAKEIYAMVMKPNKDFGAEDMDPMFQELIEANLDILKYKLINTTVIGFSDCEVKNFKRDSMRNMEQMSLLCPKFELIGKYELKGYLLTEAAVGNGDYTLKSGKYRIILNLQLETLTKNGKNYRHIKSFTFQAEPLERVYYDLTNLFGANNEPGDKLVKFINDNWKPVTLAFQHPILKANLKRIIQNTNKYMKHLPI